MHFTTAQALRQAELAEEENSVDKYISKVKEIAKDKDISKGDKMKAVQALVGKKVANHPKIKKILGESLDVGAPAAIAYLNKINIQIAKKKKLYIKYAQQRKKLRNKAFDDHDDLYDSITKDAPQGINHIDMETAKEELYMLKKWINENL